MAEPAQARRTFGPVVLLGLAGAGLAAVAGSKPWVRGSSGTISTDVDSGISSALSLDSVSQSPLAAALSLVVLACWGVVLVAKGRVRRAVSLLAAVAALGLLATTAVAPWTMPEKLTDALFEASGSDNASTSMTAWFWVALVASVLVLVTNVLAVRWVPAWPEMGSRYDAPTGSPSSAENDAGEAPTENIDMWKALDQGRDPTA